MELEVAEVAMVDGLVVLDAVAVDDEVCDVAADEPVVGGKDDEEEEVEDELVADDVAEEIVEEDAIEEDKEMLASEADEDESDTGKLDEEELGLEKLVADVVGVLVSSDCELVDEALGVNKGKLKDGMAKELDVNESLAWLVDADGLSDASVDELSAGALLDELALEVAETGKFVTLYKDSPFGPPQICEASAAHGMLQRPSVTGAEPATRLSPQ